MIQKTDAEILLQRARALASSRVDASAVANVTDRRYLVAVCGTDTFLIALESVIEVFRPSAVMPLPRAVAPLWGLTSWRGSIVPIIVVDQSLPAQGEGIVIILARDTRVIAGLWANQVETEIAVGDDAIQPAPDATGIRGSLTSGVTSDAMSVFNVENLERMLDDRTNANDRAADKNFSGIKV